MADSGTDAFIIRRLSNQEILYDNEAYEHNLLLSRVFLIDIGIGIARGGNEVTLDLLKSAATHWVQRHPILGAEVLRNTQNPMERYFIKMSSTQLFRFNNIELIDKPDVEWKQVMDLEIITDFDMSTGPLWRMKFIKLGCKEGKNYNHALILTTQHSIGDGRNCYELGVQFLNIVAALLDQTDCAEMNGTVEHSLYTHDELLMQRELKFERGIKEHDTDSRDSRLIFDTARLG